MRACCCARVREIQCESVHVHAHLLERGMRKFFEEQREREEMHVSCRCVHVPLHLFGL